MGFAGRTGDEADGDSDLRHYLYQVIHRCVEYGSQFKDSGNGISRGCPLSPVLDYDWHTKIIDWLVGISLPRRLRIRIHPYSEF